MMNRPSKRQLVITVDTEEEGLWSNGFPVDGNTTENLKGLARFQSVCESLGAPPTYLVDAPVVEDAQAMKQMTSWQEAALCEVGAHCHAWCNPPIHSGAVTVKDTFLNNYPRELQFEKLNWLTNRIADITGRAPTSYRSGRYGFDATTAEILDDLGYLVDSSVLPLFDYSDESGPNFLDSPRNPYPFFATDESRKLLEVPVTSGFIRPGFGMQKSLWVGLRKPPWRSLRLPGILDRLGIARRVKLTPEGTILENQRRLIDACVADGMSTLVLMLHSSSLVAGLSPYAPTPDGLESLYARFKGTADYAISKHGFSPIRLTEVACSATPPVPSL